MPLIRLNISLAGMKIVMFVRVGERFRENSFIGLFGILVGNPVIRLNHLM